MLNLYFIDLSKFLILFFRIGRLHEYKHVVNIKELDESLLPDAEVPGFTKVIGSVVDDFISLAAIILQFIAIGCGKFHTSDLIYLLCTCT